MLSVSIMRLKKLSFEQSVVSYQGKRIYIFPEYLSYKHLHSQPAAAKRNKFSESYILYGFSYIETIILLQNAFCSADKAFFVVLMKIS